MKTKSNNWKVNLYNKKHAFVYQFGEELIELLDPKPDELILDLGCGSGQLTNEISKNGAHVVGIDSSKEMISDAKSNYPELDFQVKDASHFHFNKPFDAIFSNAVLHWVLDAENAILNMNKNLRSEGRLVLEFGGKGNVATIVNSLRKSLEKRGYLKNAKLKNWYFPSISEYTFLLEKNGFEVEYAHLYDRPTKLADNENGIKDWIEMFGSLFFVNVSEQSKIDILEEVQNNVKSSCFNDGKWVADYRRIRILAKKIA